MAKDSKSSRATDVKSALAWLKAHGTTRYRDQLGSRFAIHTDQAYGTALPDVKRLAQSLGTDHELAQALKKVVQWAKRKPELERRAAFALLASVALHDKTTSDGAFLQLIPLAVGAANDERNFVKKGVSWALRAVGTRSAALHEVAVGAATALAASEHATERWVGKDVLRDLTRPLVAKRIAARDAKRVAKPAGNGRARPGR